KLPEGIVGSTADTVGISRAFRRPVVHLERKVLKHEPGCRLGGYQRFNRRLGSFAGGTLQIAEFDDGDGRILRSACRTGDSLLQLLFCRIERVGAEGNNLADESVLAILSDIELAQLLALRTREYDGHLSQFGDGRRPDAGDFPGEIGLIAELLVQKRIDSSFRRKVRSGVGSELRGWLGGSGSGRGGRFGLSCGQATCQQKNIDRV